MLQHVIEELSHIFHTNHYLVMQVTRVTRRLSTFDIDYAFLCLSNPSQRLFSLGSHVPHCLN